MTSPFRVNLIAVINKSKTHVLMCHRQKDHYYLKYNFVGGKVLDGESSLAGAYRELKEETGICGDIIEIKPLLTSHYFDDNLSLEIFSGVLSEDFEVIEEANPLVWIGLDEDFSSNKYAGDGNVQHIIPTIKYLYSL